MADLGTMTKSGSEPDRSTVSPHRRIRRARGLPGGRAVVGALLVTGAAVGVFAAYLNATAEPSTAYLVAGRTIEPGTRFADLDDVLDAVRSDAIDVAPELAARLVPVGEVESLVGRVVLAPLEFGDLITRTVVVDDGGVAGAHTMSIPIARSDAVAGTLRAGERIDVLATYGSGDNASTAFVVRGVPLLRVTGSDGEAVTTSDELILTVAVTAPEDVQALGHAVNTASVFVTRSLATAVSSGSTPGAYRFSPDAPGPAADPSGDPVGGGGPPPATDTPDDTASDPVDDASETDSGTAAEGNDP